jgi:hypothetical protein
MDFSFDNQENYLLLNPSSQEEIEQAQAYILQTCKGRREIAELNFFLQQRGIDTVLTVFQMCLIHTNHLAFASHYAMKSIDYYIETLHHIYHNHPPMISSTTPDIKKCLRPSSRDAVIYTYKKTICHLLPIRT